MIIYGTNSAHVNSGQSKSATCPSCGTKGEINISVYRQHAHVFWIPLFPFRTYGASQCQHCKHTLENKEMPDDIKQEYFRVKSEKSGPI